MQIFEYQSFYFKAFSFDEILNNVELSERAVFTPMQDGSIEMNVINGGRYIVTPDNYVTLWDDGDLLIGDKKYIDENANIIKRMVEHD